MNFTLAKQRVDAAHQAIASIGRFETLNHQFDPNGNQIGITDATTPLATFSWDYEDRLKSAEIDGLNLRITAVYDVDHRRIARIQTFDSATDSSRFIWDSENVLQVTDNSNVTKVDYTLEPSFYGELISQKQGPDSVYHHFDALGSTHQLTGALGAPVDSYDYTAYGAGGPALGAVPNLYQFVGELGYSADNPFLLYIRRRWYFTFFGRWASRDKVNKQWYLYCDSSPGRQIDPSGYEFQMARVPYSQYGPHADPEGKIGLLCGGYELAFFYYTDTPEPDADYYAVQRVCLSYFKIPCCRSKVGRCIVTYPIRASTCCMYEYLGYFEEDRRNRRNPPGRPKGSGVTDENVFPPMGRGSDGRCGAIGFQSGFAEVRIFKMDTSESVKLLESRDKEFSGTILQCGDVAVHTSGHRGGQHQIGGMEQRGESL